MANLISYSKSDFECLEEDSSCHGSYSKRFKCEKNENNEITLSTNIQNKCLNLKRKVPFRQDYTKIVINRPSDDIENYDSVNQIDNVEVAYL